MIGSIPDKLKDEKRIDLLVQAAQSRVNTPLRQTEFPSIMPDINDRKASAQTAVTSQGRWRPWSASSHRTTISVA